MVNVESHERNARKGQSGKPLSLTESQGRHREESLICCKTKNTLLFLCGSSDPKRSGRETRAWIYGGADAGRP